MDPQIQDARDQAFLAAGVKDARRAAAEAAFEAALDLDLGGEEALKRALIVAKVKPDKAKEAVRRFNELQALYEARLPPRKPWWRRWRSLPWRRIAILLAVLVMVSFMLFFTGKYMGMSETSETSEVRVTNIVDSPLDATSVPPDP